jgi:hypothetical protein
MKRQDLKPDEETARRLVSKVLGAPVSQYDFNAGVRVPDLRIDYPDRPAGFVEVVSDTLSDYREMDEVLRGGVREQRVPGLQYDWWVWPKVTTRIKRLVVELPRLLHQLEAAAETFGHQRTSNLPELLQASQFGPEFRRLGIDEIVAGADAIGDAVVRIDLPGTSGPAMINLGRVVSWVGEFLNHDNRADVRSKLAQTKALERHAFIVITLMSEWDVHHALTDDGYGHLPAADPELPDEVTHVWLLGTECADRCIAWLPEQGGWVDYAIGPWHR